MIVLREVSLFINGMGERQLAEFLITRSRESPYFDQGSGYFSNPSVRGLGSFLKRFPKNCIKEKNIFIFKEVS